MVAILINLKKPAVKILFLHGVYSFTYLHGKQDSACQGYYSVSLCVYACQMDTCTSEADNTANVSNDVINQTTLITLTETDNLKPNEAYSMVMTCSTNRSYSLVKPARRLGTEDKP